VGYSYATAAEALIVVNQTEGVMISNDESNELFVDTERWNDALSRKSRDIDSVIASVGYTVPVMPAPELLRDICIYLAWESIDVWGGRREQVVFLAEDARRRLTAIAEGKAVLIGADGQPIKKPGGDVDPGISDRYSSSMNSGDRSRGAYSPNFGPKEHGEFTLADLRRVRYGRGRDAERPLR
jgi:phage gp36-like protein